MVFKYLKDLIILFSVIFFYSYLFSMTMLGVNIDIHNKTGHNVDISYTQSPSLSSKDQNNSNSNNGDKQDNRKLITRLEPDKHYLIDVYQLSNPENLIIKYSYGTRQYWSGKIIIPASKIESLGKKFFNSTINLTLNPKKFKNHNYVTGFELPEVTVISNLGKSKMSITYNITVSDISSGKDMVLNF